MRKLAVLIALGATVAVVPSVAARPSQTPKAPKSCTARTKAYLAHGMLVSSSLTALGHGRYSGMLEVNVVRGNHHTQHVDQMYPLTNARVIFHHGVDATSPAPGSGVVVHGTVTVLPKGCSTTGFTPTITVKKVDISKRPPHTPHS